MKVMQDGVEYYNSGSWIDERPTFITVGEDGVQIREYEGVEQHAEEQESDFVEEFASAD